MSFSSIHDPLQFFVDSAYKSIPNQPARYSHDKLGYFSIDQERYFLPNKSQLGILNVPCPGDRRNLDIDLNVGFEGWKNLPNVQQHLDSMLYWILLNKELMTVTGDVPRDSNSKFRLNVDFVTSRGNLARLLSVLSAGKPDGKGWTMLATRYRGTIYLSHIENNNDKEMSTFGRKICYWGKRFEVEVTNKVCSDRSEHETVKHGPMKAYPGFFSVMRFQLENHAIALRAEVDAETQSVDEQRIDYVELKITTETLVRAPWAFNKKRLVPWWCQSIVSGTPLVVYGIRDYDGHVKSIEEIRTDEIPDRVGRENLDKDKYLLFLSDMLSWIKNAVCANDGAVYMIQWDPNAHGMGITANLLPRDADDAFLREWYVSEMEDYFGQQRNWNDLPPTPRVATDQRSSRLPAAGHKKRGHWEIDSIDEEEMPREMKEVQRDDQEMKMERMKRRFEDSWPRTTTPEEKSFAPREEESSDRTTATAERYMRDHEQPLSRERGAKYRNPRPDLNNGERQRTALEIDYPGSCSKSEPFRHAEHKREHSRLRERDWEELRWTSPLAEERSEHDDQGPRFRRPSSPYAQRSRRATDGEASRYERRSQRHDRMRGRARSGRKPEDTRPSRFSTRTYSPSSDEQISGSRPKRVKRDTEYNERMTRH